MPELPEVETIRRQLAPHLEGRTLTAVEILDARWTRPLSPAPIEKQLRGASIERVGRRGKYLLWSLSGQRHLLVHLRMTGALLFDPPVEPPHTRVRFELDDGHRLAYVDPRRFGTGHLVAGDDELQAYLVKRIGVEPFTAAFTAEHLRQMKEEGSAAHEHGGPVLASRETEGSGYGVGPGHGSAGPRTPLAAVVNAASRGSASAARRPKKPSWL